MTSEILSTYRKALKTGQRCYHDCLDKGIYPYLQTLEELTSNIELGAEIYLGDQEIPLKQVVGTNSRGRSTAFSADFMPLLDEKSEFAAKWMNLCQAHLDEGIREPIKCYEFFNRYYVVEGNKRVSVLKFFDAVMVRAQVTRIMPRPSDTPEFRLYSDYLKFYRVSGVNYCLMSREGNYSRLLELLEKPAAEDWTSDFRADFMSGYSRFEKAFRENGGEELSLTAGDGLVEYLKFFTFDGLLTHTQDRINRQTKRIWKDIRRLEENKPIFLAEVPEEEGGRTSLWERLSAERHLRVAFVHDRTPLTSSWTYCHEQGRLELEKLMGAQIATESFFDALSEQKDPEELLARIAEQGFHVIFTTSPRLREASLKCAAHYPNVKILNCSVNLAYRQIRTYYGRMYEAKFLAGLVAGTMTKNDTVAYIADYPLSGLIANINGFARGVQTVNPDAKVYLLWSTEKGRKLSERLSECGADIVSSTDTYTPVLNSDRYGVFRPQEDGSGQPLCQPFWNWDRFYAKILRSILSGAWELAEDQETGINYWWGLSSGVVDFSVDEALVPEGVCQMVKTYKRLLSNRSFGPFDGFVKDQNGLCRSMDDGYVSTRDIVTMDWLLDNVIGRIPGPEELSERAREMMTSEEI